MGLLLAFCLLLGLLFLWGNGRAGQLAPSRSLDLEEALAVALAARPKEAAAVRDSLNQLARQGWSQPSLVAYLNQLSASQRPLTDLTDQLQQFASPLFECLFQAGVTSQETARQLLTLSLDLLGFPEELSGQPEQVSELLSRMWPDLSPHARFWSLLARAVDLAFPNQTLQVREDDLARRVHQLRYFLSTYQAVWLRRIYGGQGLTDRQALVAYLVHADARDHPGEWLGLASYDYQLTYDLGESARLHNKRRPNPENPAAGLLFPENQASINLKILINYHSEFILSSKGDFLLILGDKEGQASGIINGASFNYASRTSRRHWELDVWPVAPHDPSFRRRQLAVYRSPSRSRRFGSAWRDSFYNPKGQYAWAGESCYRAVKRLARALQADIKAARKKLKTD